MSSKVKKIAEWILIGLFIAIVASIASIQIYRSVVNSDWYTERQARKSFEQMAEKVNDPTLSNILRLNLTMTMICFIYTMLPPNCSTI